MRTRARVGLVAALATVLVGATSTVAYAASYNTSDCHNAYNDSGGVDCWVMFWRDGIAVGGGEFHAYGEHLFAYDSWADGRGVYVGATWWEGSYRHENGFKLTSGANTSRTLDLGNIPEGTNVTFTSCQTDDGALLNCYTRTGRA